MSRGYPVQRCLVAGRRLLPVGGSGWLCYVREEIHHLEEILIWFERVIKIKTFSKQIKQDYKRKNNVTQISKHITIIDKSKCNMMLFDMKQTATRITYP